MESGGGWALGVMGAGGGRGVTRIFIFISEHNTELFIKKNFLVSQKVTTLLYVIIFPLSSVLSMADIKCKEAMSSVRKNLSEDMIVVCTIVGKF